MSRQLVHIIGAGLAGSEAAYFLASRGFNVVLHEMRPERKTPAHQTENFAELVCSNSLKSENPDSAPGILKAEMKMMGSLILQCAEESRVPGGDALAVDRNHFSEKVTRALQQHPKIEIDRNEVKEPFSDGVTLIATGPLTSDSLSQWIARSGYSQGLYFYDAIAPIIESQSIDRSVAYLANRYEKGGEKAYLNCPFEQTEYEAFVKALLSAEKVPPHNFEKEILYQGCQPIEAMAERGVDTLRFGPMRPVGLPDPRTGKIPYAVVQLRPENQSLSAYNLVGFQTKLKWGEQTKIFRMIPGLEEARFLRLGSIHRNTYVCGPTVLRGDLSLRGKPNVYLAGQITGVEGYLESAACGLMAANFIGQRLMGRSVSAPPITTAMGALLRYLTNSDSKNFQPTNMHFGLFETDLFEIKGRPNREELRHQIAEVCKRTSARWWASETVTSQVHEIKDVLPQAATLSDSL